MLDNLKLEALSSGCAKCSKPFIDTSLCTAVYRQGSLNSFDNQIEVGLIGTGTRNFWVHLNCEKPTKGSWTSMIPDIHTCIKCSRHVNKQDMIQPVFQVVNPREVNPADPEDIGMALGDRIYFVHADCENVKLDRKSGNILLL